MGSMDERNSLDQWTNDTDWRDERNYQIDGISGREKQIASIDERNRLDQQTIGSTDE